MTEQEFADQFPNFTLEEMQCSCGTCRLPIAEPEFVSWCHKLQEIRTTIGHPFHVSSFYRCPDYNDWLYQAMGKPEGTHRTGPHTVGATDIVVAFERAYNLAAHAFFNGLGVGIKQHGDIAKRMIHLDNQGQRLWTYT